MHSCCFCTSILDTTCWQFRPLLRMVWQLPKQIPIYPSHSHHLTVITAIGLLHLSHNVPQHSSLSQGQTEICGRPAQANNLVPLQTNILKKCVQHLSSWDWKKLIFYLHLQFTSYVWSHAWTPELTGTILLIYSSYIFGPL
jgi:hypothetical protein